MLSIIFIIIIIILMLTLKKNVCMKWLLRNEIHSLLLDTNYEANVQSSFGIKTPLISLFWLNQERLGRDLKS